jgi:hypothetical protein
MEVYLMKFKFLVMFVLLFCFLVVPVVTYADTTETVTIPKEMLTEQQKTNLEQKDLQTRIETYGSWIGIGKEIGMAVDSSLNSLTTRASEFANTKLGGTILWLVIYKVVGVKFIQLVIGIPLFLFLLIMWVLSFKTCFSKRVLSEKSGPFWNRTKKYAIIEPTGNYYNNDDRKMTHFLFLALIVGLCSFIIFI